MLEPADRLSLWTIWKQLGEDRAVVQKELACPHSWLSLWEQTVISQGVTGNPLDYHHSTVSKLLPSTHQCNAIWQLPHCFLILPLHSLHWEQDTYKLCFSGSLWQVTFSIACYLANISFHHRSTIAAGLHGYNGILVGLLMAVFSDKGDYYWWLLPPVAVISMAW